MRPVLSAGCALAAFFFVPALADGPGSIAEKPPIAASAMFDGTPITLSAGPVSAHIKRETSTDPKDCEGNDPDPSGKRVPCDLIVFTVEDNGKSVLREIIDLIAKGQQVTDFRVKAQIRRLDPSTKNPQVIVSDYSGGAHCCGGSTVATETSSGVWLFLSLPEQESDAIPLFLDLDGNGGAIIVSGDLRFDYAFASFTSSAEPTRLNKLSQGEISDVTLDPRYRGFLRGEVRRLEQAHTPEVNGYLAAWVAQKATIGEFKDAWAVMLRSYDKTRVYKEVNCSPQKLPPVGRCPEQVTRIKFPVLLATDLLKWKYVTRDQLTKSGVTPPPS